MISNVFLCPEVSLLHPHDVPLRDCRRRHYRHEHVRRSLSRGQHPGGGRRDVLCRDAARTN